ncbi:MULTISPECIES: DUF4118 domain-containing protein [unclassified Shewanella]|uniref:DUF4118 domain-containing protein n=1 Tax=Shewanella TaxID=22 RepID=UPI0039859B65
MVLQLVVVMITLQCCFQYAYMAAFFEAIRVHFLFNAPYHSLPMIDVAVFINLITFIVIAIVATISQLAIHLRRQQRVLGEDLFRNLTLLSIAHDFRTGHERSYFMIPNKLFIKSFTINV